MDHNYTHTVNHNHTLDDNELDEQIAFAAAAQNEYDDWKRQLAADCHKSGVHFPVGHALQRAWNTEQRKRAEQRKQEKKKDAIRKRIAQLQAMLGEAKKELEAQDDGTLPDFDAMTAELLQVQQQRELADKEAKRQQEQLFGEQPDEGTKLHPRELTEEEQWIESKQPDSRDR